MGKCKDCGAPTLEGEEYCESCLLLRDLGLADDSEPLEGADSLLSSVGPNEDVESLVNELNIDEDIMSFLNEETRELEDRDILHMNEELVSSNEEQGITDDDIMSILSESMQESSTDEGSQDDIMNILGESMTDESDNSLNTSSEEKIISLDESNLSDTGMTSDVGDILSDALGVLNDSAVDDMEEHLKELMSDEEKKEKEDVKSVKGLFKKLFGNVPGLGPDPEAPTEEELDEKRQAEKEAKQQAKAAKKLEQKQAKEARKKAAEAKKATKKATKQKLKEEAALNEPVDNGKINKVGASIVLGLAACLLVTILIGTNTFTYANNVSSAKDYFSKKQYTKAYQQVAGINIKKKDKDMYNKITTVMYVNKEYDSFNNYYNMEMYPQSLDSLIKGLKRYDKCKEDASELQVMNDLDYVKSNIVHSLKDSFNLKENEVQYLLSMNSQDKYSREIIKLAKTS